MRSSLQQPFELLKHKPEWFVITPAPSANENIKSTKQLLQKHKLHSICEEANCPNLPECWKAKTATFLLMGDVCTRSCKFCYVKSGKPMPLDTTEPTRLADAIRESQFDYVVLTSVNRDDLPDGGAAHFAACAQEIKKRNAHILVEVLIPDFQGDKTALQKILDAQPDVIAHNLETVASLQKKARDHRASYAQTLGVLDYVKKKSAITTKSSLILGLGETEEELIKTFEDLRAIDVDILTLGQYLQPSKYHLPVTEFVSPEQFDKLKMIALSKGFKFVAAGPFVRSSYKAGEAFVKGAHASLPH